MPQVQVLGVEEYELIDEKTKAARPLVKVQMLVKDERGFAVRSFHVPPEKLAEKGFKKEMVSDPFGEGEIVISDAEFDVSEDFKTGALKRVLVSLK